MEKTFYAYPDVAITRSYNWDLASIRPYNAGAVGGEQANPGLNIDPDPHGIRVNEFDGLVRWAGTSV